MSARIEARQHRTTPGWTTTTGTNEEKRLLAALLDYLHESADSIAVLQYLTKEFRPMAATLHTVPTIRKVRSRLLALNVPYIRHDSGTKQWSYWNDYTVPGIAAWTTTQQDIPAQMDIAASPGAAPLDPTQPPGDSHIGGPAHTTGTVPTALQLASPDPPADKDPPADSPSPHSSLAMATDSGYTRHSSPPSTQSPPLLHSTPAGPSDAAATSGSTGIPQPAPIWFQSPKKIRNPYTGQIVNTPATPGLQAMVQDLQNHDDWYHDLHDGASPPKPAEAGGPPPMDEDGFITVHTPRRRQSRVQPHLPPVATPVLPAPQGNMYQALMDEARDNLTEHAHALENQATTRHRQRMEHSQTQIQSVVTEAIEQIQHTMATQCSAQKATLDQYCDAQVESLIADLDNFSGQARQIQQELLNGVRDDTNAARMVPVEDEDNPALQDSPSKQSPTPTRRRFPNVNYQEILQGSNPSPPPMDSTAMPPSSLPDEDNNKYTNPEYQLPRLRSTSTPTQLRTRERKAVIKFYNGFVDFVRQYGVPIKTFDQLQIENLEDPMMTVYPTDRLARDSPVYSKYSAAIYARLEEEGILDPTEPIYRGLLQMYNRTRDGYNLLKAILAATLMVEAKNLSLLSTPPPVDSTAHPFEYASQLQEFFQFQTKYQRHYTDREQVLMFLQGMQQVRRYALSAAQLVHDLEQHPPTGPLAHRLCFLQIPITLDSHPATLPMPSPSEAYAPARLNVTRASSDDSPSPSSHNVPTRTRRGPPAQRTRRGSDARLPKDVQCPACAIYGHELADCRMLPKVAACLEYIQAHPPTVQSILHKHKQANHPQQRHSRMHTRAALANKLQGHLMHQNIPDVDSLIADITDTLLGYSDDDEDVEDDPGATLYRLQAMPSVSGLTDDAGVADLTDVIHPVKFPLLHQIQDNTAPQWEQDQQAPIPAGPVQHTSVIVSVSAVQQRDLADTGASVSATGLRHILHDFTEDTRYEITGYDGTVTKAAGEGYAHVRNPEMETTDRILFVYAPSIAGTIFSLEHHAQTHPRIHRWTQEATPSTQGGWITFYDDKDGIVSRYPTIRSKGVYYIQDMQFIPTVVAESFEAAAGQNPRCTSPPAHQEGTISSLHATLQPLVDYTYSGMTDTFLDYVHVPTASTPLATSLFHTVSQLSTPKMEADILNFEVWHQRLAHCSEHKLRLTQQHVDGIPAFRQSTIPPLVRCRACDVANLKKAPRGPETKLPTPLTPGQVFHMDIGFFRGPGNLMAVYDRQAPPSPKLVESRQGFVCYLLIIDRCTRYIWIFPLRSKSVPPALIRLFLQTHGTHARVVKTLRTDGEGSLAESPQFRQILIEHGYTLEKTATDTSSQNGLAERPHRTLGEMTRCLLYSAAMPIYFWADALVYAAYIHNRLYHEGVKGVPYNLWTGRRANVKHIRTFGSRVLVKRSGPRPTKGDPHYYDGRFLRFGATDRNIIYFDEVTQREKIARHCNVDEFHYASPSRPPGAQQVLEKVAPHVLYRQHPDRDVIYLTEDKHQACPNTPLDTLDPLLAERHQQRSHPTTAVAASAFGQLTRRDQQMEEILHAWLDTNQFLPSVPIRLPLNRHPTLGFILAQDSEHHLVFLQGCQEGTAASRIPRWRSTIRHAVLRSLNGTIVKTIAQVRQLLDTHRRASGRYADFEFAKVEPRVEPDTDIPHLHFDQLRHINQLHIAIRLDQHLLPDPVFLNLTRSQLKKRDDYDQWRKAEWTQHDKYKAQGMFGAPIPRPRGATILPFVWTYLIKEDPVTGQQIFKARGTCNGGKRYGRAVTLAETYATCVEQPACRMYWSLTASEGLIAMGADAGNAFAEAPPPVQPFFMIIDDQFAEWWTESEGQPPIPEGYVLPVQQALQGHPESPRLWEHHIHHIITKKLQFRATTHEKCLYSRQDPATQHLQLLLRQVDDFSVSAHDEQACKTIITAIGSYLKVPLNDLGLIRKFNGVNVLQTRWYIKISCQDYLLKILDNHGWLNLKASHQPTPMRHDPAYHRQLELTERPASAQEQQQLQQHMGFSYRTAVGELIYALVIARPEISLSTTKLSQYGANPASPHYSAVKAVFAFLNNTREDGLIFWRQSPRMDLPDARLPTPYSTSANALPLLKYDPAKPIAFSDSDWGSDFSHRRSISGMIIMLSGAAIVYKTRYQKAVALSSTEAEFVSAADTGKMILYVRSILQDLGFPQQTPTQLHVDNTGALFMVEAQAPTKRTRHVDIRYFALMDWASTGQLTAVPIRTDHNISDSMTKATGRIKFHQHADIYMGRVPPLPLTASYPVTQPAYVHAFSGCTSPMRTSALQYFPLEPYGLAFILESMGG